MALAALLWRDSIRADLSHSDLGDLSSQISEASLLGVPHVAIVQPAAAAEPHLALIKHLGRKGEKDVSLPLEAVSRYILSKPPVRASKSTRTRHNPSPPPSERYPDRHRQGASSVGVPL